MRELRAAVETAAALAGPDGAVDAALLGFAAGDRPAVGEAPAMGGETAAEAGSGALDAAVAALESRMLADALGAASGNRSEAARRLGISRVGLGKKLKRLGLDGGR